MKTKLKLLRIFALGVVVTLTAQGGIKLTALNSMERIFSHQPQFGKDSVEIFSARNEVESFQVVVGATGTNLTVSSVILKELVAANGNKIKSENIKLYREEYVRVRKSTPRAEFPTGLYPDPLVPFLHPETGKRIPARSRTRDERGRATYKGAEIVALPFDVWDGYNQPLWVDVHVPANTEPGVYNGTMVVNSTGGNAEIAVKLTVWDFVLPDSPSQRNHLAHSFNQVGATFGVKPNTEELYAIEKNYGLMMRDHRLTTPTPKRFLPEFDKDGSLKIDPDSHAALTAFRKEMHLVDFEVPRYSFNHTNEVQIQKATRYYSEYQKYLAENGWLDKAYVYTYDEPNSPEAYEAVVGIAKVIHAAAPGIKCLVTEQTYQQDPKWVDIDPGIDIWCPLFSFIDRNTINQKLANGDEVWSYTALVQRAPSYHPEYAAVKELDPPYWHTDRSLLVYRVPTWINRQYNITGLLYWGSLVYSNGDPWHTPALMRNVHFNSSGFMIYPGAPCDINGPIASTRLKNLRDGMEDYEYFMLLEKKAGKEAVMQFVNRVAPTWWEYVRDPETILQVRKELAAAIMGN